MSNARALERIMPVLACDTADINGAGVTGDYFDLSAYERMLVVVIMGDGTASSDPNFRVYQATDNAGSGAKVLNALETGRIYTMYAASYATYAALTAFTKVTQATADEQYNPTDTGESVGTICFELRASDLDATNSFTHVRCDITDPGASKVVGMLYIGIDPHNAAAPELMDVGF